MAEPAAKPSDRRNAEGEQPLGDRAGVHDVCGDDEQRNGEQDEAFVKPLHDLFARKRDILAGGCKIDEGCQNDRIGNRSADAGEHEERRQAEKELLAHSSVTSR